MKTYNKLRDDDGRTWEFLYEQHMVVVLGLDGSPAVDGDGRVVTTEAVSDLRYREEGDEGEWLRLPSWADIREEWKVNLCFFDEDDDGELTFWEVTSVPPADVTMGIPGVQA